MESLDSRDDIEKPLLHGDESPPVLLTKKSTHARDVHILSFSFLLIFLAFGAAQNLESTVDTDKGLGTTSLGIVYSSFALFSLVASPVVRALGSKTALLLGTSGYWLFIAVHLIKQTWYIMYPISLYLGFASSIIWVEQGTYLTSAARRHARDNNLHEGKTIGNFNGEFWMMFACRQEGTPGQTKFLYTVFLCSMTLGIILMCFLNSKDTVEKEYQDSSRSFSASLISFLKSAIAPLFDVRMLFIIPLMAYTGLQQAFVWAEFTKYVVTPSLGMSGVGGAMAVYGFFDAICSLVAGRLTSGLKTISLLVSGGALLQAVVFVWLLLKFSQASGLLSIVAMAALLGIGDGVFNTQISALLGMFFKRDTEGAFAQLKVWQSGAIAVIFFISPCISLETMVVVMLTAVLIAYGAFVYLFLHGEEAVSSSRL
ncbi:UNC93-like protein 3 isoform X2 [Argentina anserina]|uniref:UNC93-like protein 3 isoform X2 n=1 Tax=Argentina anserina TaxID=57926 RepID=UPI002176278D|nr:UNC93-like protein 3 isoform X2 [Potentilla anserina]